MSNELLTEHELLNGIEFEHPDFESTIKKNRDKFYIDEDGYDDWDSEIINNNQLIIKFSQRWNDTNYSIYLVDRKLGEVKELFS